MFDVGIVNLLDGGERSPEQRLDGGHAALDESTGRVATIEDSRAARFFSTRPEPTKFFSVPVEGKPTLETGLDAAVDTEIIDGFNWELPPVDGSADIPKIPLPTQKRQVLQSLPPHVVLHLRRFAFDMSTFTNKKVDDFFAFPHLLDLRPYTVAGMAARHRAAAAVEGAAL